MINVILQEIDGADLRRKQRGRYVRCYGKNDDQDIQDAINNADSNIYTINDKDWERIFGVKKLCQAE